MNFKGLKIIFCLFFLFGEKTFAQNIDSTKLSPRYQVHYKKEIPVSLATSILAGYAYYKLPAKQRLTPNEVLALKKTNVNAFDRNVFKQPFSGFDAAERTSNIIQYSIVTIPILIFLDKKIRQDWKEISVMYYEAQLSNLTLNLGSSFIKRPRPFAYNTNLTLDERRANNSASSFYSGHTSSVAVGTFFMAKVYDDYHNLSPLQKILLYGGASIPPIVTGYYRIKGGKHFRTDVLAGLGIGAAVGILIQTLHKTYAKRSWSVYPNFNGTSIGFIANYKF